MMRQGVHVRRAFKRDELRNFILQIVKAVFFNLNESAYRIYVELCIDNNWDSVLCSKCAREQRYSCQFTLSLSACRAHYTPFL